VDAGDHQTERLKSPPIILFGSIANQETVHRTGDRNQHDRSSAQNATSIPSADRPTPRIAPVLLSFVL
jgi:hypothetical protein